MFEDQKKKEKYGYKGIFLHKSPSKRCFVMEFTAY